MCIRVLLGVLTCAAAVGAFGCQTYRPAPFDSSEFARRWNVRPDAPLRAPPETGVASAASGLAVRTLSLQEAEAYALLFNPTLRLARQRAGVAGVRSDHAGMWDDPSLGVDVERVLSGTDDPWVIGGTVNLTLPISGRLQAEKARAAAEHHAELTRVAGEEFAVRHQVRSTWVEWNQQTQRHALLSELAARLDAMNRITSTLAESGSMSRVEARVFELERASRQAELIAASSRVAEVRIQLHTLLGFSPDAKVDFQSVSIEVWDSTLLPVFVPASNYAVRLAAAEHEASERKLKREIQAQYPDLVIGPGFGTDQGDERALLGVSLPLPIWNRNQPAIAAARAERELAAIQLEVAIEQATAMHATEQMRHSAAQAQRRLYASEVVPAADAQAADAQRLAELGEINAVLLLDAFVRQYESRLAHLNASLAESLAAIRISELSGESPSTQPAAADKALQ